MELFAQRREERGDHFGRETHLVAQRLLRAQHEEALADRRHHALKEGVVDARRVDEGLAQPGGRSDVEGERAIAVLQVEVDERHPAALLIGEIPCEVDRQCSRPHATAHADEGDHRSEFLVNRTGRASDRPGGQCLGQKLRIQRLDDVVGNPCPEQIAIEADLVAIADRDHRDAGLADLGQVMDLRYRQVDAADVDDQDVGRPLDAESFDDFCQATARDRPMGVGRTPPGTRERPSRSRHRRRTPAAEPGLRAAGSRSARSAPGVRGRSS